MVWRAGTAGKRKHDRNHKGMFQQRKKSVQDRKIGKELNISTEQKQ